MSDTKKIMDYEGFFGKAIIESIPGSFTICDSNGRLVCWNDYFRDTIIGKPESEMLHADAMEVFHQDDKAFAIDSMRNVLELGIEVIAEGRVFLRGGPKFQWRMITGRRIIMDNNPFVIAVGIDITERKRFEAQSAFRRHLLGMADTHSVDELLNETVNEAQRQTGSKTGFCQLVVDDTLPLSLRQLSDLHYKDGAGGARVGELSLHEGEVSDDVVGDGTLIFNDDEAFRLSDIYSDMKRALFIPLMQGTTAASILCVGDKPYDYDEDDSMMVVALSNIVTDIVSRKCAELSEQRMQNTLLQAQKMELVGKLAGGVAHDVDAMLGVILGNVEMAIKREVADDLLLNNLQAIVRAAEHSAGLTTQLLAFSKKQMVLPIVLDLNMIVEKMLVVLRKLIGTNTSLVWIPESQSTSVKIDPAQIELILANLCANSRDAITGSGKITIETCRKQIKEACNGGHSCIEPGDYVMLVVTDNGCGIEKKDLPHIYEPFFTTKKAGKGRGMGLSAVYGIVKQNNGGIQCQSEKGRGTTFQIWLPRHSGYADLDGDEPSVPSFIHGKKRILLVEDDPEILNICKLMLENNGYEVLAASTPVDAIRISSAYSGDIHLLLTNVVLPEMNGCDLSAQLTSIRANLKTLFMSGYMPNILSCKGGVEREVDVMHKPFSIDTLLSAIKKMFDQT
jgi:two-component system, cell cycle sensor histidine kinase and response regulator CckA